MRPPIVTGVHPRLGWDAADRYRRLFAVLAVLELLAWPLLATVPYGGDIVVGLALTTGPPAFYSAARVLRPHLVPDAERRIRHACASASTAFGTATIALLAVSSDRGSGILVLVPATVGLLVTVPWGLGAVLVRVLTTPRPSLPTTAAAGQGAGRWV